LAAVLWARAEVLCCLQAAIRLLIGHRRWLCRDDFVAWFVWLIPLPAGNVVLTVSAWRAVVWALTGGRLPCSDGASRVPRIAAGIAEGFAVELREFLSMLDGASVGLVVDVVRCTGDRATPGGVGVGRGERS
jgi:hypothetical protein